MSGGEKLRSHQFAKLRGINVKTFYRWVRRGWIAVERDEGGRRFLVDLKNSQDISTHKRTLEDIDP
jgi:predicted site-specific integrase-resolvase